MPFGLVVFGLLGGGFRRAGLGLHLLDLLGRQNVAVLVKPLDIAVVPAETGLARFPLLFGVTLGPETCVFVLHAFALSPFYLARKTGSTLLQRMCMDAGTGQRERIGMTRSFKVIGGAVLVPLLLVLGLFAYRKLMLFGDRTAEGYELLTAMPGATGFEPTILPSGPVLENQSTGDLAVNFGYKVGTTAYSFSLALSFPDKDEHGKAKVIARHATQSASVDATAVRRWDEPRKAYAVALIDDFGSPPGVPSLCIKAVIGPSETRFDLKDGSICIAQRDRAGHCHPETLACGLMRQ